MKLTNEEDGFYCVTDLCKATTRIIRNLPVHERYLLTYGEWYVHETQLPDLFKKAKATGNHETLSYASAKAHVRDKIEQALGKKRVTTPSLNRVVGARGLLYLNEDAPAWMIEAAWKAFVKHQHPDVGGDSDHFVKVKSAYESLKENSNEGVRGYA